MTDFNEIAASAYGMDYLYELATLGSSAEYEPEEPGLTVRRVQAMNRQVVQWIATKGRIPTTNPSATEDERKMGHYLRALQFYMSMAVDPQDRNKAEYLQNETTHKSCQHAIRTGYYPEDHSEDGD